VELALLAALATPLPAAASLGGGGGSAAGCAANARKAAPARIAATA
jgi:hypothetical protein